MSHPFTEEPFDRAPVSGIPGLESLPSDVEEEDQDFREAKTWLETVYQGDKVPQLSARSIISGMLLGGLMSLSNLYVGLKTGWGMGVTITACILAFALFKILEFIVPSYRKNPFTILENNTMSSAASAAGYMASAGLVSAIPALYLTTGRTLTTWEMMSWLGTVSILGVFMAIPLKRQMINIEKLPFPSGIATAETLKSMHTSGKEAFHKAISLTLAAAAGALVKLWNSATFLKNYALPDEFPLFPGSLGADLLKKQTFGFEGSLMLVAAGAIMGIRVGISLLIGAIIFFGFIGNWLISQGIVKEGGYREIVAWTLWPSTALMVTSSLLSFAFRWKTILRSANVFSSLFRGTQQKKDPLADIEVPVAWFVAGTALSGLACIFLAHSFFDISWWMGLLAVAATFLLSIVAARATGETDVTPIGAMGKITQLMYGAIAPSNITTNLMTASITAGASSHSADLLTDLKCGYLLGGNARKQTIAQIFGVIAGTLVCVPVYSLIAVPEKLGTEELPAPAAKVWEGVANLLSKGIHQLPRGAVAAMIIGGALGILLAIAEEFLPPRIRKWLPSATGLGIAGVVPAFNSVSMFVGALAAWIFSKTNPKADEKYTVAISSGLIAGESLMGVAVNLWTNGAAFLLPYLSRLFRGQ